VEVFLQVGGGGGGDRGHREEAGAEGKRSVDKERYKLTGCVGKEREVKDEKRKRERGGTRGQRG
jgi:hypothetical protein